MTTSYRVEAHDGTRWSFGIELRNNLPQFCGLEYAPVMSLAEARKLKRDAARVCGGTLRVRKSA